MPHWLPRPTSLATRLFLASALLLPLLLGLSAFMLHHAYQRSLRAAERDALRVQMYILLGAAEPQENTLSLPPVLPEPRYSSLNSGLVGWVVDENNRVVWRSRSGELLTGEEVPQFDRGFRPGREQFATAELNDIEHYGIAYDTLWQFDDGERGFRFLAMQDRAPMYNELEAFRRRLRRWLGSLAVSMILVQTVIARWALAPLRRLARDLERVESGEEAQLAGHYPADIQPVTDNLNRVLASERSQRERYRNTLADLAHSLKTPLAVIRAQLQGKDYSIELRRQVDEQVSRMSAIVDHQLRRASAKVTQTLAQHVPVAPLVDRLTTALGKVYAGKNIQFEQRVPTNIYFRGDDGDLMEVVGNLMENACKYGRGRVRVSATARGAELAIVIEDNGAGVAPDQRETILERGARADTAAPGQGLGLSVAVDILSSYEGSITIDRSELGGARFQITLPGGQGV